MYIHYNNKITIFDNDEPFEKCILYLKLTEKYPEFSKDKINLIINIYNGMTIYNCKYSEKLEKEIMEYCNL